MHSLTHSRCSLPGTSLIESIGRVSMVAICTKVPNISEQTGTAVERKQYISDVCTHYLLL